MEQRYEKHYPFRWLSHTGDGWELIYKGQLVKKFKRWGDAWKALCKANANNYPPA